MCVCTHMHVLARWCVYAYAHAYLRLAVALSMPWSVLVAQMLNRSRMHILPWSSVLKQHAIATYVSSSLSSRLVGGSFWHLAFIAFPMAGPYDGSPPLVVIGPFSCLLRNCMQEVGRVCLADRRHLSWSRTGALCKAAQVARFSHILP